MDIRELLKNLQTFDQPGSWTVVRVLRSGNEEVMARGVTLDQAADLAHQLRGSCHMGEVISLREAWSVNV